MVVLDGAVDGGGRRLLGCGVSLVPFPFHGWLAKAQGCPIRPSRTSRTSSTSRKVVDRAKKRG